MATSTKEKRPMLVLSRKVEEAIVIDDNIRLKVIAIQGKGVRLSIQAPMEVIILGSEVAPLGSPAPIPASTRRPPAEWSSDANGGRNRPPAKQGSPHPSSRRTRVLRLDEAAIRAHRPGQVLVTVRAAGANP